MQIGKYPRVRISTIPTPLEELPRFSAAVGGPRILMKRDDLTGLGMGGNKARQLEFIMGEAVGQGERTRPSPVGLANPTTCAKWLRPPPSWV